MTFTTPQFVLFLVLFLWMYHALPHRFRKVMLLGSSYLFYASWSAPFVLLIFSSTLLDFLIARSLGSPFQEINIIEDVSQFKHPYFEEKRRRLLLGVSLIFNLGALAFFKYFNFFIESSLVALEALGVSVSVSTLSIALPVGISFYTFQTLSYTVDVYRGKQQPTHSLLDFALYVAYFPQLVAGPIERAGRLLPQLSSLKDATKDSTQRADLSGWVLIALGAFKKVVIADHFATLVDTTYATPSDTYPLALWVGTYAFAIQIYCDFSGYSDIAVGVSRLLGIELSQNFKSPYAARNPSEFWRRWHISLSEWLRDYLYISLGGGRDRAWKIRRNLMITMLLGGLWHGASWNFIAWGAMHGVLLLIYRMEWVTRLGVTLQTHTLSRISSEIVGRVLFFHLVCLSWVLFRATTLQDGLMILKKLTAFWLWSPQEWKEWISQVVASGEGRYLAWMMGWAVLLILIQNLWKSDSKQVVSWLWKAPQWMRLMVVLLTLYITMLLAPERPPPFIYFQF